MDSYVVVLALFGALVLLTAWLPMVLKEAPLSLPIVCVVIGAVLFSLPVTPGPLPNPPDHPKLTERLTELVVIIALMGAGLKLDRPVGLRSWALTWRLIGLAMPLTILALAVIAYAVLGVGVAAALLLAAALAPTDPVLASDVQVGPPMSGETDEARFALTSEAGLNDGLAFPFVWLAIVLAGGDGADGGIAGWFTLAVLWKIAAGVAVGLLVGQGLAWTMFHIPNRARLSRTGDGFVALGVTTLAYGVTEMASGYGFLAVFVAALALRNAERNHQYHEKLHAFSDELERLLTMVLLVLFGGALVGGGMLAAFDWRVAAFAVLAILLVRPVVAWLSLAGSGCPGEERAAISFFGIRGIGSFYYLAFALNHADFGESAVLWTAVSVVVLVSILLHGTTVSPAMRQLDMRRQRRGKPAGG
jgi:NhaP-type Na+/H+ or K+/H+ antiporter